VSPTAGTERTLGGLAVAALVGVALVAPVATAASGRPAARSATPERFVVAISVDGLNPDAIAELGPERAPTFHRLLGEGVSTLDARTAVEQSVTLPNHTGMLTGRRVETRKGHHIDVNDDEGSDVHSEADAYRASFFDVVHDRGGRTALYASKTKFALFDRSWSAEHGAHDHVGRDHGADKIDLYVRASPERAAAKVARQLRRDPFEATFLHLASPDRAGHAHGWMGPEYLDAVERTDERIGAILDAARSTAYLRKRVVVVVTADHGGAPGAVAHDDRRNPHNYTIPFFVWGAGVETGADLYDLNPDRVEPRANRPGYRAEPPIRNTDLASLVTTLLGHRAVPGGLLPGTEPLRVR
jgi:predicted AlkP superfamily pyrophosphatase or phosphodiesterase